MPHTKSAVKHLRKSQEQQARSKAVKARLKTLTKKFIELVEKKKLDDAKALLPGLYSEYDKAAKKGVIKSENADRHKGRLTVKVLEQKPDKQVKKAKKAEKKASKTSKKAEKPAEAEAKAEVQEEAAPEAQPEVAEEKAEESAEETAEPEKAE